MAIRKIITSILLFFLVINYSLAQSNKNFDEKCTSENSKILYQSVTNLKGKKFVSRLIKKNTSFLVFLELDSAGFVLDLRKIKVKGYVPNGFEKKLEHYLIKNKVKFYYCYEKPSGIDEKRAVELINIDKVHSPIINIPFPGNRTPSLRNDIE